MVFYVYNNININGFLAWIKANQRYSLYGIQVITFASLQFHVIFYTRKF